MLFLIVRVCFYYFCACIYRFSFKFRCFAFVQWPDNGAGREFAVHWLCGASTHLGQAHIAVEHNTKTTKDQYRFAPLSIFSLSVSAFLSLSRFRILFVCVRFGSRYGLKACSNTLHSTHHFNTRSFAHIHTRALPLSLSLCPLSVAASLCVCV